MSLDIWLIETRPTKICDMNMTHNVSNMWRKAGVYDALYLSAGRKAKDILTALANGIKDMESNPEEYQKLDSPNGWGTYEYALPWLQEFYEHCKKNPEAKIGLSA